MPVIVKNPKLLKEFARPGNCEYCGRWCEVRDPHHVLCRAMGGGARLDLRINLVSLGSSPLMLCPCHGDADGRIDASEFFAIIAQREQCLQSQIMAILGLFGRLIKPTAAQLRRELAGLPTSTRSLAYRDLAEAGVLEAA